MAKKPNLAEAFSVDANELQPKPELQVVDPQPPQPEPKPTKQKAPKKKHIGGYFSNEVYTQVKILGAETGMTTHDILAEASTPFFGCTINRR